MGRKFVLHSDTNTASGSDGSLRETRDDVLNVEWTIKDFFSRSTYSGPYTSPTFQFSDCAWYIEIFHHGDSGGKDTESVACYLYKQTRYSSEIIVTVELGIKEANGGVSLQHSCTWYFHNRTGYGLSKFCTRSELLERKTDLLPYDTLTISCTLKKFPPPRGLNSLTSDFEDMLASARHSDVTLHVKSKEYKAHKSILASRSSVFKAMFEHEMAEKNSGEVSIADCDPESFQDFLRFLYTGRADITESNVAHLYKTADKYCVEELKRHCVAFLMQNLSLDNVCDVAALRDQYSDDDLDCYLQFFFEENIKAILLSSKWGTFMKENHHIADKLLKSVAPKIKVEKKL